MVNNTSSKASRNGTVINYRGDKENKQAVDSTNGNGHSITYKPLNKKDRDARRRVYERFCAMRDDPIRKEAEKAWDLGRKMYRMWAPEKAVDDWGADVILPDGFSAIQTHMQETIDARFRPMLDGVESSDDVIANFNNAVFQHAMDVTEYDAETTKARRISAMCGTAFTREEYRYETRDVMDPVSFENGAIKYEKKELVDWDDVYTRSVVNENCYFDEGAEDPKYAVDCIYREVLPYDTFIEMYEGKPGFKDVDQVVPCGSLNANVKFFAFASDVEKNDVEILHYENMLTDSYDVLANNVLINSSPLQSKHKQLSLDVWTFYPIDGQIYGIGIPQIIYTLVEERRTNRNQRIDRGTLQNHKMFLLNDLFDIDEDDLVPRPHGLVKVNTNGLPLRDAVMPLEYGDVPVSSIRMDEELLADERRAHGMGESNNLAPGATATQAAILKEDTQRRIGLVNTMLAWNTIIRLGKKKWSNVQFFYPAGRIERVLEDNKWRNKTVYKKIKTPSMEFSVYEDKENGGKLELKQVEIPGKKSFQLDPTYAQFMSNDMDVVMNVTAMAVLSKAIKRQETNEMFDRVMNNPLLARYIDGQKAFKRMLLINDEDARDWMMGEGLTDQEMKALAEKENMIFLDMVRTGEVFMLPGTPGATEAHTEAHLEFTRTAVYNALPDAVKAAIENHILEENEKNPNTANLGDMMGGGEGGGLAVPPGQPGGPAAGDGLGALPGSPIAGGDVTAQLPVA